MTERKSGSRKPRSPEKQPAASDQPSFGIEQPEKRPSVALVVAVMLTAILEVLDITIVSAIPHMLGSFGATSDQITWVLTSYLVSAAVVMPLTGYLSKRLGRNKGGRADVSNAAPRPVIVLGQPQLGWHEETGCLVMSHHGDGDHRIAEDPANEAPVYAILGNPATVVNLGEQHEAAFTDIFLDLFLESRA